ncbi:putative mitochondrial protein, partial [Mucuna pruriens]
MTHHSALKAILGQRVEVDKQLHAIAYASRTMDLAQFNYTTTKKELLAIVFALDKFRSYLLGSKIIIFPDHAALWFLLKKSDAKLRLIRWMLLLQEFDIVIRDKNVSTIRIQAIQRKIESDAKCYISDNPYLWKLYNDQVIRSYYGSTRTSQKVLDSGFYWPTIFRDTHQFISSCEQCQKAEMAISRRHEMPQQPIVFCEVFDVWGIILWAHSPFPISNGYSYILLVVDYVSQWVEATATKTNDSKVVVDFVKSNIFYKFGMPKALISDQGSHFCNRGMSSLLEKYQVVHRVAATYHPQINSQAEVFNKEIKKILQKMANPSQKEVDSLRMLYGHTGQHTKLRYGCLPTGLSSELEELRLEAYENSQIYKQKVKQFHDSEILRKEFRVFQKVLLFNSRLKLIISKLRSR